MEQSRPAQVYDKSVKGSDKDKVGPTSNRNDDRVAMADVKNTGLQLQAAATLAAASRSLRGYDDELADTCLETAIAVWNDEEESHTSGTADWLAAVELTMAAEDNAPYKARVLEMLDTMLAPSRMGAGRNGGGWKAVRLIPYMDAAHEAKVLAAVEAYVPYLDGTLTNPFGVPDTNGMWGGSTGVVDSEYTYRVMDYILGTHAYNDTSWLSGVGTNSVEIAYGSNRKEDTDKYSIDKGEGLRMPTQAGDIYQTDRSWNNVFLRPAGGDWEVVAKIHYPAAPSATFSSNWTANMETAGSLPSSARRPAAPSPAAPCPRRPISTVP